MDEFPDVSFYVLTEPALVAPPPDEISIWQELAHLRTENHAWRECVQGILEDVRLYKGSRDALTQAIRQRIASLGARLAQLHER